MAPYPGYRLIIQKHQQQERGEGKKRNEKRKEKKEKEKEKEEEKEKKKKRLKKPNPYTCKQRLDTINEQKKGSLSSFPHASPLPKYWSGNPPCKGR